MNEPNIRKLVGYLRELDPTRFSMRRWIEHPTWATETLTNEPVSTIYEDNCGTVACLAGHAVYLFSRDTPCCQIAEQARELLGLENIESVFLFDPHEWGADTLPARTLPEHTRYQHLVTPRQAAQVLDHLRWHGEVDWSVITENDNA